MRTMSRREGIRTLALLAGGLAAGACAPLRIVMHLYPEDFDRDPRRTKQVLRGFTEVVLPGVSPEGLEASQVLTDPYYPLAKYAGFLASDLCRRADDRHGVARFDALSARQRTAIVADAIASGGVTAKLYNGAVFLTQIAFFAGIYRQDGACPEIGFDGQYRFRGIAATSYPNPQAFLGREMTADGNPA